MYIINRKKALAITLFFSLLLFTSCYTKYVMNKNGKTKLIVNSNMLHINDTLYIVEPFTRVYIKDPNVNDTSDKCCIKGFNYSYFEI
jgi:hypothetical protein